MKQSNQLLILAETCNISDITPEFLEMSLSILSLNELRDNFLELISFQYPIQNLSVCACIASNGFRGDPMFDKLVSIVEAAKIHNISKQAMSTRIQRAITRGVIHPIRINKRKRKFLHREIISLYKIKPGPKPKKYQNKHTPNLKQLNSSHIGWIPLDHSINKYTIH